MINFAPPLRRATPADAAVMAELVNMAGEGLPLFLWTRMAKPGQDPWEVGRRRAMREEGAFSYRNTVMLEAEGRVAASLVGYPLANEPEPIDYDKLPAMFVPLQELENLAGGTWYVNVLATYPEHRGKGFGTRLLEAAEGLAKDAGLAGLSIIVSDANSNARRLYQRIGSREIATRPKVKEEWRNAGKDWVLLVKRF